ncbi:MAG: glycosyltransferase family 2 protein, partial [Phycisphaerae bacterium]
MPTMFFTSGSSSTEPTSQTSETQAQTPGPSDPAEPSTGTTTGKVLENLSNSLNESIAQPAVRVGKELKSMLLDPPPAKAVVQPTVRPSIRPGDKPRLMGGLTVLIPAYNEGKFVADTIKSVQAQSVHVDHIIVIDDCSTDNTGDVARACGPEIVVIRPPKNCGSKATALNFGMEYV